jgi:hypothetical protein
MPVFIRPSGRMKTGSLKQLKIRDAILSFIKSAPENPVLWTGVKGASAESRKNKSDAETSSA